MNPVCFLAHQLFAAHERDRFGYFLARNSVRRKAAFLAIVAFALTPKASSDFGVLWNRSRGDLLMALFSILAVLAGFQWTSQTGSLAYGIPELLSWPAQQGNGGSCFQCCCYWRHPPLSIPRLGEPLEPYHGTSAASFLACAPQSGP